MLVQDKLAIRRSIINGDMSGLGDRYRLIYDNTRSYYEILLPYETLTTYYVIENYDMVSGEWGEVIDLLPFNDIMSTHVVSGVLYINYNNGERFRVRDREYLLDIAKIF